MRLYIIELRVYSYQIHVYFIYTLSNFGHLRIAWIWLKACSIVEFLLSGLVCLWKFVYLYLNLILSLNQVISQRCVAIIVDIRCLYGFLLYHNFIDLVLIYLMRQCDITIFKRTMPIIMKVFYNVFNIRK